MWSRTTPVLTFGKDPGLPYGFGWLHYPHDPVNPDDIATGGDVETRWHGGDFVGTHCRFARRDDGRCFAYLANRNRTKSEDDEGTVSSIWAALYKLMENL